MREHRQLVGVGDVITTLYSAPLVIIGLIWLITITDLRMLQKAILLYLMFAVLIFVFNRVNYFFIVEIRIDRYGSADGSLASMIQWTAIFLLGPMSLWLSVFGSAISLLLNLR